MFDWVLKSILLLSTLIYARGDNLTAFDIQFFHLSALILFTTAIFSKPRRTVDLRLIGLLMVIAILNLFLNSFNKIAMVSTLNLFMGCSIIIVITIFIESPRHCARFLVYGGLINIFIALLQKLGYSPMFNESSYEEYGATFGHAPALATFLALTLPFVKKIWVPIYILIGILFKEISILLVGFLILFFYSKYKLYSLRKSLSLSFLILIGILGLIILNQQILSSLYVRWKIWNPTIEQIFARPIGYGLGLFPLISNQFIKSMYHADTAFSSFLQFIFEIGIIGTIWICMVFNRLARTFDNQYEQYALIALGILCLIEYPFQITKLWMTICFVCSICLLTMYRNIEWRDA